MNEGRVEVFSSRLVRKVEIIKNGDEADYLYRG
jgi:hypothetical protein